MIRRTLLLALALAAIPFGQRQQLVAAPQTANVFVSPLHFNGRQWRIESDCGPVYLARMEGDSWKVLAIFDGTNGDYYLDWKRPVSGIYAAVDPFGRVSESLIVQR